MKPLLVEMLESILSTDENLAYCISIDGDEIQSLTRDTSLACNQKEGDKYVGVNAVDEARIEIWSLGETQKMPDLEDCYVEGDHQYIGFIYWTNYNAGIEKVVDYSVVLDEKYGLNKTYENWGKKYDYL